MPDQVARSVVESLKARCTEHGVEYVLPTKLRDLMNKRVSKVQYGPNGSVVSSTRCFIGTIVGFIGKDGKEFNKKAIAVRH